jgi:hypothetical protein
MAAAGASEIVAFPRTLYVAPAGTEYPEVDAAPGAEWFKLGSEGNLNYDEDGVSTSHPQTIETFTPAGSTAPRKAFRTEESLTMAFNLVDLSTEQFAKVLDDAAIVTQAAAAEKAGTKSFNLLRGSDVNIYALLARGQSPEDNDLVLQYQWPTVYQSGEPAPVHTKGKPSMLAVEFTALEIVAGQFGEIIEQTAAAGA